MASRAGVVSAGSIAASDTGREAGVVIVPAASRLAVCTVSGANPLG